MKNISLQNKITWSIYSNILNLVNGVIIIILISRGLGTVNYGNYETIIALLGILVLFADYGISASTSRFIAENVGNHISINSFIRASLLLKLIIIVVIGIISYLSIINYNSTKLFGIELKFLFIVIFSLFLSRTAYEYLSRILQGLNEIIYSSKMNIVKIFIQTVLLIILYLTNNFNLLNVLKIEIFSFLVIVTFMLIKIKSLQYSFNIFKVKLINSKMIIVYSMPLFLISLCFMIYTQMDIIIIQYFMTSYQVGIYAIVLVLITKIQAPFTALGFTFAPIFAGKLDKEKNELYNIILFKVILMALPLALGLFAISSQLFHIVFGSQYNDSIKILQILSIYSFFLSVNTVFTPVMDFMGKAKLRSILMFITAFIKIVLSIYLIQQLGLIGLAYSSVISYVIYSLSVNIYLYFHINREKSSKETRDYFKKIFLLILINIIMFITVKTSQLLFSDDLLELLISVLLGMLVYLLFIRLIFNINIKNLLDFN